MAEENPFARLFTRAASTTTTTTTTTKLAALQPGSNDEIIKVSLVDADPTTEKYDCISYDRSKENSSTDIQVDGESFAIPKPLEIALRSLRRSDTTRKLWADVLIGDTPEQRSAQAAAARPIFENAETTICWLGPGDPASNALAFDIAQTAANRQEQARLHAGAPEYMAHSTAAHFQAMATKLLSYPSEPLQLSNAAAWKAIEAIFSSSYFRSVQSIPDVVLAKAAVVNVGNSSMRWSDFVRASRALLMIYPWAFQKPAGAEMTTVCAELINSIDVAAHRLHLDDGLALLPMIQSARECASNDPREYVFAMLPITRPGKRAQLPGAIKEAPLVPDYSKTAVQVFTEAARSIVHERQDFLLWWGERPPCGQKITGLPSWVPDWTWGLSVFAPKVSPNNGMRQWWEHVAHKSISVDGDLLNVQGHAIDRIAYLSPTFTHEGCRRQLLVEWRRLLLEWQGSPFVAGQDMSMGDKVDKFMRTLVLDNQGLDPTTRGNAKPPRDLAVSLQSVMCEEQILELLGCTMEQLNSSTELQERAKADENMSMLGARSGHSAPFEDLLRKNAIGRRFFITRTGKIGMTAVETKPPGQPDAPPVPNFDQPLGDPMGGMMMNAFREHLRAKNPEMARALDRGLRGELPGQAAPGVRVGDLVVALVGGFQPYILHPVERDQDEEGPASLGTESRYKYVGDCYVHDIMDGEPFKVKGLFGNSSWKTDVELVDISIV